MATAVGSSKKNLETTDPRRGEVVGRPRCLRCGGLMVAEWCFDLLDDSGSLKFLAGRCVQCGDLVDPVILRHRQVTIPEGPEGHERN